MASPGTPERGAVSFPPALVDRYGHVLLDIDGVVRRGPDSIPGAGDAVAQMQARGVAVTYVTNNSSATPVVMADTLRSVGVAATPEQILSSAMVAAAMLQPGTRCLVIGMSGLLEALEQRGCTVVDDPYAAEVVVVGIDRQLTWDSLRRATFALRSGARFVATNDDPTFPTPEGLAPGNGAIVAALERASDRRAEVAGKPHAPLLLAAARRCDREPVLFVGDRHTTDVVGAAALGWDTALVLTGVTGRHEVAELDPQPTYVLESVTDLVAPAPAT